MKREKEEGKQMEKRKSRPFAVKRSGRQSERKEKQTWEEQTAVCKWGAHFYGNIVST